MTQIEVAWVLRHGRTPGVYLGPASFGKDGIPTKVVLRGAIRFTRRIDAEMALSLYRHDQRDIWVPARRVFDTSDAD